MSCPLREVTARRTWPQRLLISFNICLIVISLITAGGVAYFYGKVRSIGRVELGNALTPVDKSGPGAA